MSHTLRVLLALLTALALAACGGGDGEAGDTPPATETQTPADEGQDEAAGEVTVELVDFAINAPKTVEAGTSVQVVNNGNVPHTFTATSGGDFDTGTLSAGGEATVTIQAEAGTTIEYECTIHPDRMSGTLEVTG